MAGTSNWFVINPFGVDVGMGARIPEAQYPDGYLSSIPGRRAERGQQMLPPALNSKSYDRGIHKYTKLPVQRYFWPTDFNIGSRLRQPVEQVENLLTVRRPAYQAAPGDALAAHAESPPEWLDSPRNQLPPWSP